jgi:YidC/Oxa1 family membrane protein insertase
LDKRLLQVLLLCIVIMVGWTVIQQKLGWVPPAPVPPAAAPADASKDPSQPADPAVSKAPGDAPVQGGVDQSAPVDKDAPIGPVISATEPDSEIFTIGERGRPGYFQARFSNRGGVLESLRTGNHFDRANLTPAEKDETAPKRPGESEGDKVHWAVLVEPSPSAKEPLRSFALRTRPSSSDLATGRQDLQLWTELWEHELLTEPGADGKPRTVGIEYTLAPGRGVTFVKRYRFVRDSDLLRFELEVRNDALAQSGGVRTFVLTPATGMPSNSGDTYYREPLAIAFSRASEGSDAEPKVEIPDLTGEVRSGVFAVPSPLDYAGVFNKYFAVLLRPAKDAGIATENAKGAMSGASWRAVHDDAFAALPGNAGHAWRQIETDVDLQLVLPPQGESRTWAFDLYAGTKSKSDLVAADPSFATIIDYDLGFTSGIAKILLWILGSFYALTSSWGVAIILLTLTVRAVLFPINRRSQTAMARYQVKIKRIQPRIEEIKKKHANDPAKLRTEQARIMQEEDALMPPLGGCLPPLLQIPIFIGLFRAVGVTFDLRHVSFMGWIHDLSLPDRLLPLDWNLPIVGNVPYLNILPPLMVVMWILQQRSMPKPTDPQAQTMYKMMMFMPVVMGVFLYNYAAGLSLYMITQSTLGIIEQKIIRKYWPVDETLPPKKKKSGFMAKIMEANQQKMKQIEAARAQKKKAASRR